jgi:hypothetical protein
LQPRRQAPQPPRAVQPQSQARPQAHEVTKSQHQEAGPQSREVRQPQHTQQQQGNQAKGKSDKKDKK